MVRVRRFIPLPSESILEAESTAQSIQPGRHLPGFFYLSRNMQILSSTEKQRYQRHLMLEEIGEEGQSRIRNASVLVVGAGFCIYVSHQKSVQPQETSLQASVEQAETVVTLGTNLF